MKPSHSSVFARPLVAALSGALLLQPLAAVAAQTPLSQTPLQALSRVKPNIMFTVDDSGSMRFEFLPDYTAEGPPPLGYSTIFYCRDRRNCGGIVDPLYGLPLDPITGKPTWAIYKADPPIRSSNYNKMFYDPAVVYNPGKRDNGTDLPCSSDNGTCTGRWTAVYSDGFAGYPFANGSATINLESGYPDTAWCNTSSPGPADLATAFSNGSRCRLNGRAYPAYTEFSGGSILWTAPAVVAGYNYPNLYDAATGATTACSNASEMCVFNTPGTVNGNPYYYTISQVQFCQKADAAGFGIAPCSDRWDESLNKYVRYGTGAAKAFDPTAFTRVDVTPAGCVVTPGGATTSTTNATCPSGRAYAEEMANFAKWYAFHRTRMLAMKTAGGIAFSALTEDNARVGLHTLWSNEPSPPYNQFLNVAAFDTTQKAAWFTKYYAIIPGGGTPLPDAMYRVGEYFANSGNSALPGATDPLDPVTGRCQANYHLLSTDGYWNQALSYGGVGDQDRLVPASLPGPVPGFTPGAQFPRPYYEGGTPSSNNLADLAMYYWARDLRPTLKDNVKDSIAPWQHVNFYALSIGAQGNIVYPTGIDDIVAGRSDWPVPTGSERPDSIDDLWHAAVNGRGKYYNARTPRELAESIVSALSEFTAQAGTGTAVGIASAQLTSTRKYGYRTSYESGWWGDVKKYALDPDTGALPVKPDGNPANDPLWSAATQLDLQAAVVASVSGWDKKRRIVTINSATGAVVPFRNASLSSQQRSWLLGDSCAPNQFPCNNWSVVANAPTSQAVLDYLRGDRSNEGAGASNFRIRSHVLGDIVYSGAVPVGAPSQPYDEAGNPGYVAFAATNRSRTPMVYVGANDGMLHALIDSTTADAGTESWAFVPKTLFEGGKLASLSFRSGGTPAFVPKFYVNATPRVWDIDFANTNTKPNDPPKTGNDWHTILVGGLGAGARAVYALDVTNAPLATDTEADIVASRRVLWEFTDSNLGYVFDAPTLVKTRRYGWVVLVASGYNNPGGKGILYVLNPTDGRILKKLSTNVGDDDSPSGLSTIRAFTSSRKDPYVLQAYGGDLRGNVWRFDLSDADESKWKVEKIAQLRDKNGKEQPITTGVRIEIDQNNNVDRYLFVGTGKLLHQSDLDDTSVTNTLYVIRDGTRTAPEPAPATPYSRAVLNAVTGTSVAGFSGTATGRGWYQDASDPKQKIATDVAADVQTVVYTFSKPGDDPCEDALASTLYAREFVSGSSVLESTGGTVVPSVADVGAIAGTALIQGQPGSSSASSGGVRVQVTTMKGQVFSFGVKLAGAASPKHRVSWRLLNRE